MRSRGIVHSTSVGQNVAAAHKRVVSEVSIDQAFDLAPSCFACAAAVQFGAGPMPAEFFSQSMVVATFRWKRKRHLMPIFFSSSGATSGRLLHCA